MHKEQEQLVNETTALIRAWQDRGVRTGDGVTALITSLAEVCAYNGFPPDKAIEGFAVAYAKWMNYRIEDHEKKPIDPPSKL